MRTLLSTIFIAVLGFATSARAASFSIVSGTLHAESNARTSSSTSTVTDMPANVLLGVGTTSGSVSSSIHSDPGQADDMIGSFTTNANVGSSLILANLSGGGSDNIAVHGIAGGSGSIDLTFNLSAPAAVQLSSSIFGSPAGNLNISENLKLLDSSQATVLAFPIAPANSPTMNLAAGNYELIGSVTGSPAFGEQGFGSAQFFLGIVPEPAELSCIAIASLALIRRRSAKRRYE